MGADSAKPTSEDRQPDEDPRLATEHDNPPIAKSAGASAQRHRGDEPAVVAEAHTWFGATPSLPLPSVWDWLRTGSPHGTRAFANYVAHSPSTRHFVGAFAITLGSLHYYYYGGPFAILTKRA